jgi:hypothetical protein
MKSRKRSRAAARGEGSDGTVGILDVGVRGSQVARAIGVGDAHNDQRRHAIVVHQKVDGTADLVDVSRRVGLIHHWVHALALLIPRRRANPDDAIFLENVGVNIEALGGWGRYVLGRGHRDERRKEEKREKLQLHGNPQLTADY